MKRYYFGLGCCMLIAITGCGRKVDLEESGPVDTTEYTLKIRTPGEGSTLRGSFKVDLKMKLDVRDNNGKPVAIPKGEQDDIREEISYRETIEAFPDGVKRPTKSRITIEKWDKPNNAKGVTKAGVMNRIVGREIIIEKVGGAGGFYDIRAADNQPIDHNVRLFIDKRYSDLMESFNIHDFLPDKPVRTYSPWDIPVSRLVRSMGNVSPIPFDSEKSKGTGKLTRVYDKEGRKYGHLMLSATLVPKFREKGVTVNEAKMELKWEIDLCIDGSKHDVRAVATIETSIDAVHPKEGSAKITSNGTVTVTEVEEKIGKAANPPKPKKATATKPENTKDWADESIDEKEVTRPKEVAPAPTPERNTTVPPVKEPPAPPQ